MRFKIKLVMALYRCQNRIKISVFASGNQLKKNHVRVEIGRQRAAQQLPLLINIVLLLNKLGNEAKNILNKIGVFHISALLCSITLSFYSYV